jgi:hypothetical protein
LKGYVRHRGRLHHLSPAGGPPFAIYLLLLRLATAWYVGTTVVFTVMNALKVAPYAQLGLFDARTLWTAAGCCRSRSGCCRALLRRRMSPKWFTVFAALRDRHKLQTDGLSGLTG